MKHETFNSMIAGLGLTVALFTAAHQLWPVGDQLQIVSEGRINVGLNVTLLDKAIPDPVTTRLVSAIGPISWKIRIHNETDRTVSVVDFDFLRISNGRLSQSNAYKEFLSDLEPSLAKKNLPENIKPRETKAYLFSFFIPLHSNINVLNECKHLSQHIRKFEKCHFRNGIDLFGNEVSPKFDNSTPPNVVGVQWGKSIRHPQFLVDFQTADGSRFPVTLAYFPW